MANRKRFLAIVLSLLMLLQPLTSSALGQTAFYSMELKGDTYYEVTFQDEDGNTIASQYVLKDATPTLPESPTKGGYTFRRWQDQDGNAVTASTPVTKDLKVTPVFEAIGVFTVIVNYVLEGTNTEVATPVQRQYFASYTTDDGVAHFDMVSDEIISPAVVSYNSKNYYPSQSRVVVEPAKLTEATTTVYVTYAEADTVYEIHHMAMQKVTDDENNVTFTKEGAVELEAETGLKGASGSVIYPTAKSYEGYTFVEADALELEKDATNIAYVYYQPELFTLTYNTQGGSYVAPKTAYSGEAVVVYAEESETVEGEPKLTCGYEAHTHTYTQTRTRYGVVQYKGGCYSSSYWTTTPSCGKTVHTHTDSCYSASTTTVTVLNPTPTRAGYTFGGWYLDADCTIAADASITLTGDTTVYAKWEAATVNYTIVYLTENADDDNYSYLGSKVEQALVGTEVSGAGTTISGLDTTNFTYKDSTTAKVKADGSTVVTVRYSRKSYTITWSGRYYKNSDDYENTGKTATLTAKYGANITQLWKTTFNEPYPDYAWNFTKNNNDKFVNIDTMPSGNKTVHAFYFATDNVQTLHYWLENYTVDENGEKVETKTRNGVTYGLYKAIDVKFNYLYDDADFYEIIGYTKGDYEGCKFGSSTEDGQQVHFYYLANSYKLDLYGYNGVKLSSNSVKLNANFSSYLTEPEAPIEGSTFLGWFVDPACEEKYQGNYLMPQGLALYAGWKLPEVVITFNVQYDDGHGGISSQTYSYGQTAESINPEAREGYTFVGWFTNAACTVAYDFNKPMEEDITVYAKWTRNALTYTVYYVDENGSTLAEAKTVTSAIFEEGQPITETALSIKGYRTDKAEETINLSLNPDQNVIVFTYSVRAASSYTVEYVIKNTDTALKTSETKPVGQEVERVTEVAPAPLTYNGVKYYPTVPVQSLTITSNAAANVITFEYLPYQTVSVVVEFYYRDSDTAEYEKRAAAADVTLVKNVGDTILANSYNTPAYTMNGSYKLVDTDPSVLTISKDMINTVQYMKLYFDLDEAGYTVHHYLDGTTIKVADDETGKMKIGDPFTATAATSFYPEFSGAQFSRFATTESITIVKDENANVISIYYKIPLTIAANSATHTYDGTAKTVADANGKEYTVTGLRTGDAITNDIDVTYSGAQSQTNAGSYPAALNVTASDVEIKNGDETITYYNITTSNGTLTINKAAEVTVTITGNSETKVYNTREQSIEGFTTDVKDSSISVALKTGKTAIAKGTDVGTYKMGLTKDSFVVTSDNYEKINVVVKDGQLKITPITDEVTVTIKGNTDTKVYNTSEQSVSGYTTDVGEKTISVALKTGKTAIAKGTDVGTYQMGLTKDDFEVTSKNYTNIKVVVVDGQLKITPITDEVTVTIKGNTDTKVYNTTEQSVSGYTTDVGEKTIDVVLAEGAVAIAKGTDVGTYYMGLTEESFVVTSENYTNINVVVVDGQLEITPITDEVTVTITGNTDTKVYNTTEQSVSGYTTDVGEKTIDVALT